MGTKNKGGAPLRFKTIYEYCDGEEKTFEETGDTPQSRTIIADKLQRHPSGVLRYVQRPSGEFYICTCRTISNGRYHCQIDLCAACMDESTRDRADDPIRTMSRKAALSLDVHHACR